MNAPRKGLAGSLSPLDDIPTLELYRRCVGAWTDVLRIGGAPEWDRYHEHYRNLRDRLDRLQRLAERKL